MDGISSNINEKEKFLLKKQLRGEKDKGVGSLGWHTIRIFKIVYSILLPLFFINFFEIDGEFNIRLIDFGMCAKIDISDSNKYSK
jgi:hypothetical protein